MSYTLDIIRVSSIPRIVEPSFGYWSQMAYSGRSIRYGGQLRIRGQTEISGLRWLYHEGVERGLVTESYSQKPTDPNDDAVS